jgi:hypothetical protein
VSAPGFEPAQEAHPRTDGQERDGGNEEQRFEPPRSLPVSTASEGLALADVDGDGFLDVIVTQGSTNSVRVLKTRCGD